MSSNIFRNYTIPIITSHAANKNESDSGENGINVDSVGSQANSEHSIDTAPLQNDNDQQYQHPNRFIAPGRQGTDYSPTKRAPKRRFSGGSIGESDFQKSRMIGRDESYSDELNSLIKPFSCELCKVQLNSPKTANNHYQSKTHDKNINAWLKTNYTEKGLDAPTIKRFYRKGTGPVGPDAYHCECCDLKLTSELHATQHYNGRKHKLVLSNTSNPSGSGYYTPEGKWVRTGSKATPEGSKDGRFGIGEGFKHESESAEAINGITTDLSLDQPDTTAVPTENDLSKKIKLKMDPSDSLTCKLCNISVTSSMQMGLHLEGTKHRKKLKASADPSADVSVVKSTDTVLASLSETDISPSDMSMYRTPSGSFYCKTCDMKMNHESALMQHLQGKKHIKKCATSSKDQDVGN